MYCLDDRIYRVLSNLFTVILLRLSYLSGVTEVEKPRVRLR